MGFYYDRLGRPISLSKWVDLFEDEDYRIVSSIDIGSVTVSTVWMGLNHNFDPNTPPLIFETMTFGGIEEHQFRYSTESEAMRGHAAACKIVRERGFSSA